MKSIKDHIEIVSLLLVLFVFHTIVTIIPPLNGDEATFWEWSRHLAFGYYAHPPMTSWLVALTTGLFGLSEYSVRLPAILLQLGTLFFVYQWGYEIFKSKTNAVLTAFLFSVLPISMAMGTIMTTDAALIFFFTASVYFSKKAIIEGNKNFWYLTGVACGGMLLSKFMAILYFLSLFLFLVINRKYRKVFLTYQPYLAAVISFIFFSPFLYWNYKNEWLTFQFNLFVRQQNNGFQPIKPFEFLAGQLLAGSPLFYILMAAAIFVFLFRQYRPSAIKRKTTVKEDTILYLLYFTAVPTLYFALLSPVVEVSPHWLAVIYGPGSVVMLAWITEKVALFRSKLFWISTIIALSISLTMSFLVVFPKVLPDRYIYTEKVYDEAPIVSNYFGWKEIGDHINVISKEWQDRPEGFFLTSADYSLAAMLGFYTPGHPSFYLMNVRKNVIHGKSFLLWEKGKKKIGANTLYVSDTPESYKNAIPDFFKETKQLEPFIVRDKENRILRIFYITVGLHYLGGEPDNLSQW